MCLESGLAHDWLWPADSSRSDQTLGKADRQIKSPGQGRDRSSCPVTFQAQRPCVCVCVCVKVLKLSPHSSLLLRVAPPEPEQSFPGAPTPSIRIHDPPLVTDASKRRGITRRSRSPPKSFARVREGNRAHEREQLTFLAPLGQARRPTSAPLPFLAC